MPRDRFDAAPLTQNVTEQPNPPTDYGTCNGSAFSVPVMPRFGFGKTNAERHLGLVCPPRTARKTLARFFF